MSTLTFQQQAVLWGQAFEVLVKRGVLACLVDRGLVSYDQPELTEWKHAKLSHLYGAMLRHLDILDETVIERVKAAGQHMAVVAYGLGYTAMREYLKKIERPLQRKALQVRALWCPLTMPGPRDVEAELFLAQRAVHERFGLPGSPALDLVGKGMPGNADFILWLSGTHSEDYLLVQEYSYDMPGQLGDFREEDAHLDELSRYCRLVDSRGVFARVTAEVDEERFELSNDIKTYLGALTADNKPFYKLCQASGYAESTVKLLAQKGLLAKPCMTRALAITPNGLESLAARFVPSETNDSRFLLMEQLGAAYRNVRKLADGDENGLRAAVEQVFNGIYRRLPGALMKGTKGLRSVPKPGEDFLLEFEEEVPKFANPMQLFGRDDILQMVDDSDALQSFFGQPTKTAVSEALDELAPGQADIPLRDAHAAAVVAGLNAARPGRVHVLGLEGNPGIGKTTAVTRYLAKQSTGYLYLYVSPRVVINRDVTEKLARRDGEPTGILTITTNAQLIASAERWHINQVDQGKDTRRHIDGAVVADGVAGLATPKRSVLVLDPEQEREIEAAHAGSRLSKMTLSENEDVVQERSLMGVLGCMSGTTRELLELNPSVNRAVLTAALQGFREKGGGKNTIQALSQLFKNAADRKAGVEERRAFAQRMPVVVVMVDELAGDGAGSPFVHTVAQWLESEFIEPFGDEGSPFTVVLIVSDASLGNEVVLDRYLNAGDRTPDKMLVSKSEGERPFRLAATKVRLGGAKRDTLHVMTNSYPASKLSIRYRVNLSAVRIQEAQPGLMETPRRAIRRVAEERLLENAATEILKAVDAGASQVVYFAQDKMFLRDLRAHLESESDLGKTEGSIEILDSSVPGWKRKQLLEETKRDSVKVFLMTSSGARGVSFPKTDWIIASVPRFSIEAALMEIAQLMYRGRGMYRNDQGKIVSGDNVPRKLVMLVDDFLVHEEEMDLRHWLRQSIDLLTLLVMLRSTIYTRITGDSGLKQKLALVPVGAVGLEELKSLMSSYVADFINEADTYVKGKGDRTLTALATKARTNAFELFSRFRMNATARTTADGLSFVRQADASDYLQKVCGAITPLLPEQGGRPKIPEHVFFSGPLLLENWAHFDKREVFSFEGHSVQEQKLTKELYFQLKDIDKNSTFPSALRIPASNLLRILGRESHDAATEFNTIKGLNSANTWVVLPAAYPQFLKKRGDGRGEEVGTVTDPDLWRDGLGRGLPGGAEMPAIPRYDGAPWAAGVGQVNPLRLDLVFDDRYFMASNEMNLLNTLLLSECASPEAG
jgi:hypothetical protein